MENMNSFHEWSCNHDFLDKFFKEHVAMETPLYMLVSPYIQ